MNSMFGNALYPETFSDAILDVMPIKNGTYQFLELLVYYWIKIEI
jgi:hypothetical protein